VQLGIFTHPGKQTSGCSAVNYIDSGVWQSVMNFACSCFQACLVSGHLPGWWLCLEDDSTLIGKDMIYKINNNSII
jgi:hypothetical protein